MYKRRLDQKGLVIPDTVEKHKVGPEQDDTLLHKGNETECGSCYGAGAEEECCNTCDEVRLRGLRPCWAQCSVCLWHYAILLWGCCAVIAAVFSRLYGRLIEGESARI